METMKRFITQSFDSSSSSSSASSCHSLKLDLFEGEENKHDTVSISSGTILSATERKKFFKKKSAMKKTKNKGEPITCSDVIFS